MSRDKNLEEKISHTTIDLPFAFHDVSYSKDSDILFYPHWHREFELFYIYSGALELSIENRSYQLKEGDCAFINASYRHGAKNLLHQDCHFYALDFSDDLLDENKSSRFFGKYIDPVLEGRLNLPEWIRAGSDKPWENELIRHFQEIAVLKEEEVPGEELFIKSKVYAIWELLYRHALRKETESPSLREAKERLLPVLNYIQEHYAFEITLHDLADAIGLSEGRFCRLFRETMGMTPFQYLLHYRIMQSCALLSDTGLKIGEIAARSGFNNISYYNKIFLQQIGCTPKHYRSSSKTFSS